MLKLKKNQSKGERMSSGDATLIVAFTIFSLKMALLVAKFHTNNKEKVNFATEVTNFQLKIGDATIK